MLNNIPLEWSRNDPEQAKLAMMEKKLKELLDEEKEAELDDIEKEFWK